jgi:hypothetical protein
MRAAGPVAALAIGLAAGLGGCGPTPRAGGPATGTGTGTGATVSPAVRRADATHEYPAATVAAETVAGSWATPEQAIRAFVLPFINWSADDVAAKLRTLAAASLGQARASMQLAASRAAGDYELQRGGISNSGRIEAISQLAGAPERYVVVTLERTTATDTTAYDGLRPAWHVAVLTVSALRGGGWAVSGWRPEN